jgi:hypothetical protein
VGGGCVSHIEDVRPLLEGAEYVGAEHHPMFCDMCGVEEGKDDVIEYVSASAADAKKEGRSFEEGKIETKIKLQYGEERAVIDTGAYRV